MNPETIKKLLDEHPEMTEFRDFLIRTVRELDTISDIVVAGNDVLVEVLARKRAGEKLVKILEPLLNVDNSKDKEVDSSEYVV